MGHAQQCVRNGWTDRRETRDQPLVVGTHAQIERHIEITDGYTPSPDPADGPRCAVGDARLQVVAQFGRIRP